MVACRCYDQEGLQQQKRVGCLLGKQVRSGHKPITVAGVNSQKYIAGGGVQHCGYTEVTDLEAKLKF